MPSAADGSRLAESNLRVRLGLSGATPGNRIELAFRHVSAAAQLRRSAHAGSDRLEPFRRSTFEFLCHAESAACRRCG